MRFFRFLDFRRIRHCRLLWHSWNSKRHRESVAETPFCLKIQKIRLRIQNVSESIYISKISRENVIEKFTRFFRFLNFRWIRHCRLLWHSWNSKRHRESVAETLFFLKIQKIRLRIQNVSESVHISKISKENVIEKCMRFFRFLDFRRLRRCRLLWHAWNSERHRESVAETQFSLKIQKIRLRIQNVSESVHISKISKENVIEKCTRLYRFLIFVESGAVVCCGILEIVNATENP